MRLSTTKESQASTKEFIALSDVTIFADSGFIMLAIAERQ
jgi:hypothetical protein